MLSEVRRWIGLAPAGQPANPHKWLIEPAGEGLVARAEEFWRHRQMLWFFSTRAVKDRYEGMTLGIFWLFFRPLGPILISTFIFGGLLKVPSDGLPYFLFFLAGVSSWYVFERTVLTVTRSLSQNRGLLKKVYFPRLIAPLSAVSPSVVDFGIYTGLLLAAFVYYAMKDGVWYLRTGAWPLLALAVAAVIVVFAAGFGMWTCVFEARHRDVRYGLRYFLRFWFYLTPVIYPLSQVPPEHRWLVFLNPMAPLVETFKWSLFGIGTFPAAPLAAACAIVLLTLISGIWFFTRSEEASVDKL